MRKYQYLFWDVDDTLLAFGPAEEAAIRSLFQKYGYGTLTPEMLQRYQRINRGWWQRLERGEVTREELLPSRFREFFALEGLPTGRAGEFNIDFQYALGNTIVYCDDSLTLLRSLKERYYLAAVTNGTKRAQDHKLSASGLLPLFDALFISEEIGHEKPSPEFFRVASREAGVRDPGQVLLIGDSLTSDIEGGAAAGYATCWYNPARKPNLSSARPDFEIDHLWQVLRLLGEEEQLRVPSQKGAVP